MFIIDPYTINPAGLVMEWDAANSSSYGGSGQTLANVVTSPRDGSSQTAYDLYFGNDSVAGSDDPTHNGTPGGESANEFFSFNGSQYFTLKSGTNTTFIESWHKDLARQTAVFWVETPAVLPSNGNTLFATCDASGLSNGVDCALSNNGNMSFAVRRDGALVYSDSTPTGFVSAGAIQMLAVSLDERSGGILFYNNGDTETLACAYNNPTSAAAEQKLFIGARDASNPLANGYKLYRARFYNAPLTVGELDDLFDAQKGRYGL